MPKKKPRRSSQRHARGGAAPHRHEGGSRRWERDVDALLAQFVVWRQRSVPEGAAEEEATLLEPLLRLKAEHLDSPDPGYWTEELIEVLLTEVVPRKVIQPREMTMAQGPALGQFFAFLKETGRWHCDGLEPAGARQVLAGLEFPSLEAADDPTRRSHSGNIFVYAQSLGVALEDPEQLDEFMTWYNTDLTHAERHELTDTGRLTNPARPFTPGTGRRDRPGSAGGSAFFRDAPAPARGTDQETEVAEDELPDWPWFLPEGELRPERLEGAVDVEQDPAGAAAVYGQIPLVQGAVKLLEFVGEGRQVTSTGALRLADVRTVLEAWQIDLGGRKLTSMWQVGEIAGSWNALLSGTWLEVTSTRVRPGEGLVPVAAEQEDPVAFVRFARATITILVLDSLLQGPDEGGLSGGPDTFTALMHTLTPGGLLLPEALRDALDRDLLPRHTDGTTDLEEMERYWWTREDLATLSSYGLLRQEPGPAGEGTRFHGTPEVVVEAFGALQMMSELEWPE